MRLAVCVATMHQDVTEPLQTWLVQSTTLNSVTDLYQCVNTPAQNRGVIGSYQYLYHCAFEDVLCYLHDDVKCFEQGWDERVRKEFEDPSVGVVGFGGGLGHGHPDIYKTPYKLEQLARFDYRSNTRDAEVHGVREPGVCDVAVLDGFALCVRRELLDRCGGWQVYDLPPMHNYDYYICLMAHRYKYKVRMVGVDCHHYGGRTATSAAYNEWCKGTKWGTDANMHIAGHRVIYENFRDVLPVRV